MDHSKAVQDIHGIGQESMTGNVGRDVLEIASQVA